MLPELDIGGSAPEFSLKTVQGASVDLASFRRRQRVLVWFSRGFTCPFCRR
jgi:putative peptide zinc metalloprotease protein